MHRPARFLLALRHRCHHQLLADCRKRVNVLPLGAAALQYPLRHPAVRIVLPGIRTEEELGQSLLWQTWPIPDDFWQAIERL